MSLQVSFDIWTGLLEFWGNDGTAVMINVYKSQARHCLIYLSTVTIYVFGG
jgi:hypothetical protein